MPERFAIYYAPATTDPLWERATHWLGRDSHSTELSDGPLAGIDRNHLLNLTESASHYGFHATLKAPMSLVDGAKIDDLKAALTQFTQRHRALELGRPELALLDDFLALVLPHAEPGLADFVAHVVEDFEILRAPLTQKQRARRLAHGLTPRQEELLDAYGYPYVFEEFFFHMTLSDQLPAPDQDTIMSAAQTWFAPVLDAPLRLDHLSLYQETDAGRPFIRIADFPLNGA